MGASIVSIVMGALVLSIAIERIRERIKIVQVTFVKGGKAILISVGVLLMAVGVVSLTLRIFA